MLDVQNLLGGLPTLAKFLTPEFLVKFLAMEGDPSKIGALVALGRAICHAEMVQLVWLCLKKMGALLRPVWAESEAMQDIGTNSLPACEVLAEEVADVTAPLLLSGKINYGTGEVVITSNEILDLTPVSGLSLSKIHISNTAGSRDVTLASIWDEASRIHQGRASATVTAIDATVLSIVMNEAQRLASLKLSGTTGGTGGAVVLDFDEGAVKDVAQNANAAVSGISVQEIADTVPPTLIFAELFFSEGVLRITTDETIRGTTSSSNMDLTKFSLHDANASATVELIGASLGCFQIRTQDVPSFNAWQ